MDAADEETVPFPSLAEDEQPQDAQNQQRSQQYNNAIRAIQEKKPAPEIDFTIHTMEDGNQVNTMERVCKGIYYTRTNTGSRITHALQTYALHCPAGSSADSQSTRTSHIP
jgi:hypothetical protein